MLRVYSGASTIVISLIYLVAQLVGAGGFVAILFGLPFVAAVLLAAVAVLAVLCLAKGGGLDAIYARAAAAHEFGSRLFALHGQKMDLFSTVSLVAGLTLGTLRDVFPEFMVILPGFSPAAGSQQHRRVHLSRHIDRL